MADLSDVEDASNNDGEFGNQAGDSLQAHDGPQKATGDGASTSSMIRMEDVAKLISMVNEQTKSKPGSCKGKKRKCQIATSSESDSDSGSEDEANDEAWCTDDEDEQAPAIAGSIAAYIDKRLTVGIPYAKLKEKMDRTKPPANTKYLSKVKINSSIYQKLPKYPRKRDGKLGQVQHLIAKGIMAAAQVAEYIFNMNKQSGRDDELKRIYEAAFDGLTLMGQASLRLNMVRVSSQLRL